MKTITTSIFFLSSIFILFSHITLGQQPEYPDSGFTNKAEAKNITLNGKKEGKWCEYSRNIDSITSIDSTEPFFVLSVYKAGKIIGIQRGYSHYKNYIKDIKLRWETHYLKGKRNGISKQYAKGNGKIETEILYFHNKRNGIEKNYYKNGKLASEITYKRNKKRAIIYYDYLGNKSPIPLSDTICQMHQPHYNEAKHDTIK